MLLLVVLTILCLLALWFLKLNKNQEIRWLLYKYKYIPTVLAKRVQIKSMK
ncbi:ac110 [Hyphantria cunea granulovirus]|uniref:Ac110 n=1 Tax=Hyphantria cunea granulovirus TaxID=307448 RepID=A0AAF1D268_9BBAC|nr:ac110 [Hyphantria cunea granulovirus]QBQ01595.1 ac110 [Hyphantria cunea granulovirus]